MWESILPIVQVGIALFVVAGTGFIPGITKPRSVDVPQENLMGSDYSQPVVIVQISDLHLSSQAIYKSRDVVDLVNGPLKLMRPDAVVFSGDMVDAKGSMLKWEVKGQLDEEWEAYETILENLRKALPTCQILDLPGNHCRFNEAFLSRSKYFIKTLRSNLDGAGTRRAAGSSGASDLHLVRRHRAVDIYPRNQALSRPARVSAASIVRVALVDATVNPAPNRHFFGRLTMPDLMYIKTLLEAPIGKYGAPASQLSPPASIDNATISNSMGASHVERPGTMLVATHFPANSIVVDGGIDALGQLYSECGVAAAISGHLHQLPHGGVPGMRSTGRRLHGVLGGDTLELEQPDFKSHERYRVMVARAGTVRFAEPRFHLQTQAGLALKAPGSWDPVVVVSSPAQAMYVRAADFKAGDATLSDPRPWLVQGVGDNCVGCVEALVWKHPAAFLHGASMVVIPATSKSSHPPVGDLLLRPEISEFDSLYSWTRLIFRLSEEQMLSHCRSDGTLQARIELRDVGDARDAAGPGSGTAATSGSAEPVAELVTFMCNRGNKDEIGGSVLVPGLAAQEFATRDLRESLLAAATVQAALVLAAMLGSYAVLIRRYRYCGASGTDNSEGWSLWGALPREQGASTRWFPCSALPLHLAWRAFVAGWIAWLWFGPWFGGLSIFLNTPGIVTAWSHLGIATKELRDAAVSAQSEWDSALVGERATTAGRLSTDSNANGMESILGMGLPTTMSGLLYDLPHLDGPIYMVGVMVLCVTPIAQLFMLAEYRHHGQVGASEKQVGALRWSWVVGLICGRPASVCGVGLLLGPVLGFIGIVLPLALFQGIDCAIASPVFAWPILWALAWGSHEVSKDCWSRCSPAVSQAVEPPQQQCPLSDFVGSSNPPVDIDKKRGQRRQSTCGGVLISSLVVSLQLLFEQIPDTQPARYRALSQALALFVRSAVACAAIRNTENLDRAHSAIARTWSYHRRRARFDAVPADKLVKIIARISSTVHDDDSISFSASEKSALASAIGITNDSCTDLVSGIHYILEAAAFHGCGPNDLCELLQKAGCTSAAAEAFKSVWTAEASRIQRALRHVTLGGPSELRSSKFERRMGGGAGGVTGDLRPVVLLDLEFGSERPPVSTPGRSSSTPAPTSGEVGESGDGRGKGIYSEGHEHLRLEFDENSLFEFFGQLDDIQEQLDSLQ